MWRLKKPRRDKQTGHVVGHMYLLPEQLKRLVDYYCDEVGISTQSYVQSLIEAHLRFEHKTGFPDLREPVDDWVYYDKRAKYKPTMPLSKRKLDPRVVDQIIRLWREGWTRPEIAEELSIDRSTVGSYLRPYVNGELD